MQLAIREFQMIKIYLLCLGVLISANAFSAVSIATGKVESVATYEECVVIKLKDLPNAFVYPIANASANSKISLALSALHASSNVELAYWATGTCTSLDSEPEAAPSGNKRYIYSFKVVK
jgi:hypothetical protein